MARSGSDRLRGAAPANSLANLLIGCPPCRKKSARGKITGPWPRRFTFQRFDRNYKKSESLVHARVLFVHGRP
jgi:hypothetical protein